MRFRRVLHFFKSYKLFRSFGNPRLCSVAKAILFMYGYQEKLYHITGGKPIYYNMSDQQTFGESEKSS